MLEQKERTGKRMRRATKCAADMGQMSHAPHAKQAPEIHPSAVLKE